MDRMVFHPLGRATPDPIWHLPLHTHTEPFTPLTYIIYPRRWNGPRVGSSAGLSTAARRGRLADERDAFLWECQVPPLKKSLYYI